MAAGELWHLVEARRDDGSPTMFRIRELDPRPELTKIFVVEMPYPITELSSLPNAAAYRRLSQFEEQWLVPACTALGWELVASKTEDGAFFLYMYGASDPNGLIAKLSPFDAALGFYDDDDPRWTEYATLRALLDQAKALPSELEEELGATAAPDLTMPSDLTMTTRAAPDKRNKPKAKSKTEAPAKRQARKNTVVAIPKRKPRAKTVVVTPKRKPRAKTVVVTPKRK
ncbi:MAG: hypothetical protein JWO36_6793, partial [Myxococcales bacterium]|nr:hypothetical protein [Myxococcales bacterium]